MSDPIVLETGQGSVLDLFGTAITLKATAAETGGAYSLIEGALPPGGLGPLPHRHLDREECFYVLEGEFDFRVAERTVHASVGTTLFVPRGTLHTFVNCGESLARLLILHSPAFEGYFRELNALAASGSSDPNALTELMTRWGMEVVPG